MNMSEVVLDFFEDLGIAYRKGFIDTDLAECSFSYYLYYWWHAVKEYVFDLRKRKVDKTLFEHFEYLASQDTNEAPPTSERIRDFLIEEGGNPGPGIGA